MALRRSRRSDQLVITASTCFSNRKWFCCFDLEKSCRLLPLICTSCCCIGYGERLTKPLAAQRSATPSTTYERPNFLCFSSFGKSHHFLFVRLHSVIFNAFKILLPFQPINLLPLTAQRHGPAILEEAGDVLLHTAAPIKYCYF